MSKLIPYGRHFVDQEDLLAVEAVLKSDWLTCGPNVEMFEKMLMEITSAQYALACSNGTTALHLALLALNIQSGDIVIVPANTFLATANAARYVGAEVIFADVDSDTGLMTAETLEKVIEQYPSKSNLKCVVNVHFAGQCENLEKIAEVARRYNLYIVEDAAHAIGTTYRNSKNEEFNVGSNRYADITTFSFHPVKTIAMGEGGAVLTNKAEIAHRVKKLRSHGMIRDAELWTQPEQGFSADGSVNPWYYEMDEIGFNYRISDISSALGLSQLKKINHFKTERKKMADYYDKLIHIDEKFKPLKKLTTSDPAWHLYVIKCDFNTINQTRAQVMKYLSSHGISSQVHYIPVYRQPYYEKRYGTLRLEGAETYYNACLSLPLYIGLEMSQQEFIIEKLKQL